MTSSEQDKRQIVEDLDDDNTDSLEPVSAAPGQKDQKLSGFAQPALKNEQCKFLGKSLHPDRIPPSQMEPELQKAIAQMKPNERYGVAREFLKRLETKGLSDRDMEAQLSLSTHHATRMNADDVTRLAAFTYQTHPDIFEDGLAEQPAIVKFLSNSLVGAVLGAIAAKWLGNHRQ